MKNSTRLVLAIVLTLVLAVGAMSVWAGSARQGTVPVFPPEYTGTCGKDQLVNFGTGTVKVEGVCEFTVTVSPEVKDAGELPKNWTKVFDYVTVAVTSGEADSVEICVPLAPEWQTKEVEKSLQWFVWDGKKWDKAKTTIREGSPAQVCGVSKTVGIFSLFVK